MTDDRGRETPAHPLETLRRRIGDALDDMWEHIGKHHYAVSGRALPGVSPSTDVSETNEAAVVEMELPGMDVDDVEVAVEGDQLVVRGEKKAEHVEEGRNYYLAERAFGRFERRFALPSGADAEGVSADFARGVLTVRVPVKRIEARGGKRIAIKSG